MAVKWKTVCKVVKNFLDEEVEGSKTLHIVACSNQPLVWTPPAVTNQTGGGHFASEEACLDAIAWLRRLKPTGCVDVLPGMEKAVAVAGQFGSIYFISDGSFHGKSNCLPFSPPLSVSVSPRSF